jgi:hypothetical protein
LPFSLFSLSPSINVLPSPSALRLGKRVRVTSSLYAKHRRRHLPPVSSTNRSLPKEEKS